MKLLVGLGNPGSKYQFNRHNAGFMFVDYLYAHSEVIKTWKYDKYSLSEISQVELNVTSYKLQVILGKPQTFMNLSGQAVTQLVSNFDIRISDLLICHDDLDIPLGKFKIQQSIGPKVHNGLESIEKSLGTNNFWRIRIGVDNRDPENRIDGETYVLQNFQEDEIQKIQTVFHKTSQQLAPQLLFK